LKPGTWREELSIRSFGRWRPLQIRGWGRRLGGDRELSEIVEVPTGLFFAVGWFSSRERRFSSRIRILASSQPLSSSRPRNFISRCSRVRFRPGRGW
jgi:hypothetical protein